jgi:aspartyl-tRNA synthetase
LELQVSDIFSDSPFKVFADTLKSGGIIKVLCVPSGAKNYSNTALKKGDIYNEAIKSGAKGLPFLKVIDDGKLIFFFFLFASRQGGGGVGYVYLKMKRYFGFHP